MRRYSRARYYGVHRKRRIAQLTLLCSLSVGTLILLVVLGNVLHDRLDEAAPYLALPDVAMKPSAPEAHTAERVAFRPKALREGIFCAPDEAIFTHRSEIQAACEVASELYDGISVTISGDAGVLFAIGESADGNRTGEDALRLLCESAETRELTTCAVWQLSGEIPGLDSSVCTAAKQLARLGFSEILFTGLTDTSLHSRDIAAMVALCDTIREVDSGIRIGFALEAGVFHDAMSSMQLEALAMSVDFLAVDLGEPTEDAAAFARSMLDSLYGSIAYYPLRVLIRGSDAAVSAQCELLRDAGCKAIQPIG